MSIVSSKRRKAKRKAEREAKAAFNTAEANATEANALRQKELHEMPEEMIQ